MTEQELADEVCIFDRACRQVGAELAQGGCNAFPSHEIAIKALASKLKRLEAAKLALMNAPAPSNGMHSDSDVHPGVMCANGEVPA